MILGLLHEISRRPELEKDFRFILYFKDKIPDFSFLNAPIFEKKIVPVLFFRGRLFPIYYFVLLPMKLWFERLDYMFWPNYMLPIIAFGKSIVMLTEDVYYETYEGRLPFRYRLAYGIFAWWTARFANKILAISETSKKNVSRLYKINPKRILVNYLGIDIPKLTSLPAYKPTSYILYVGQMFPRRHAKETILAFEKLGDNDLALVMIGSDKYPSNTIEPFISDVNSRLGREAIIHKDYVNDEELAGLYSNAKALIYVSDREAFGLPPMEALSFGVSPIVMDNELSHELFGEYAFYTKDSSIESISQSIREALSASNEKIRCEGPVFVKKYNWKNFADKFITQLNE